MQRLFSADLSASSATSPMARKSSINLAQDLIRSRLFIAVLTFAGAALMLSSKLFLGMLFIYCSAFVVTVPLLTLLVLVGRAIIQAPARPLYTCLGMAARLPLRFYGTIVCAPLFLAAYTTFKINIPLAVGFYADPSIASLDHWLHGADPWRVARSLPPVASVIIDFIYSRAWFLISLVATIYISIASPPSEFRRFVMTGLIVYIGLGIGFGTLFASVGPIYYDRFYPNSRFAELVTAIAEDRYAVGQKQYIDYLYSAYLTKAQALGSGISAMPSIHVAMSVLIAWYASSRGAIWAVVGWAYAAVILFCSVYTGWHYAIDGYFSALVTSVAWLAVTRLNRIGAGPAEAVQSTATQAI